MVFGICTVLLATMCVMRFFPNSAAGLMLNLQLVELPLRRLEKLERHHLIFLLVITALLLGGGEAMAVFGTMDVAVIFALDVSVYIDAMLAVLTLASVARSRSGLAAARAGVVVLGAWLRRVLGRRRVRNAPVRPVERKSANDDDHPAALPLAA